jgi:phenylalanine-4-hydroxylase
MGAIYWYTFEFGAIKEEGKIKPFSAGIAGSYAECINFTQPHI